LADIDYLVLLRLIDYSRLFASIKRLRK